MRKVTRWMKQERVLMIAAAAAAVSMFFTPPSRAYLDYIDFPVLGLLFCLMAVVAGLTETGVFDHLSAVLLKRVHHTRTLAAVLTGLCFMTSMFITNDVALLTFVPLTLGLLRRQDDRLMILTIVFETMAANLGSLVTPIGNPQNLYLYTYYTMSMMDFLKLTLPLGLICLVLLGMGLLLIPQKPITMEYRMDQLKPLDRRFTLEYGVLFAVCLLTVAGVISHLVCFLVLLASLLLTNRALLKKIDYALLLTFVCFFVFVGNMAHIPDLHTMLSKGLAGHELLFGALTSQIFSNVPAAVMLSGFTDQAKELILGTNIGGLGTLVASLASLISYRLYCQSQAAHKGEYVTVFTVLNVAFLLILLPVGQFLLL